MSRFIDLGGWRSRREKAHERHESGVLANIEPCSGAKSASLIVTPTSSASLKALNCTSFAEEPEILPCQYSESMASIWNKAVANMNFGNTANRSALFALGIVHAVGINSMYGLVFQNGYVDALRRLYFRGPFVLPGSNNPILTRFTGIFPLDKVLTLAGIMFCNILDGSTPQSSLYSFYFAGQLVPVWTIIMVEGLRQGNKNTVLSWPVIWGCLMQGTGYGFIMPTYCILHLLYSPTAARTDRRLPNSIRTVAIPNIGVMPAAIVIGYIVPSIAMSVPLSWMPLSFPWNKLHQWLAGLWQGFPVWVTILRVSMARNGHNGIRHTKESISGAESHSLELKTLQRAYSFAYRCSAVAHLGTFAIIGLKSILPCLQSVRNPLTFRDVFVPPRFWSVEPMPNMAIGIQNFFQYDQYIGSMAAIVWALALQYNLRDEGMTPKQWSALAIRAMINGTIAGPAGVVSEMMRERDQYLLGNAFTPKNKV